MRGNSIKSTNRTGVAILSFTKMLRANSEFESLQRHRPGPSRLTQYENIWLYAGEAVAVLTTADLNNLNEPLVIS